MRSRPASVAAVVLAGVALSGCSNGLTERTARAMVDASEEAARHDDFDGLSKYITDDCVLHEKAFKTGGSDSTSKSCKQAVNDSRQVIANAAAQGGVHKYASEVFSVEVQGGKAIAKMKTVDTVTRDGHVLELESHQTETLELRNGQVMITGIEGESEIPTMDGRRIN